ncbi:hypothetical protein AB0N09_40750 [Streptomyces erythrochromogenes]|uniref:hypothetical protein n=1 Tax=Streptomyces erythrochromogenes TaxID=285574 RepID=UPI00342398ED
MCAAVVAVLLNVLLNHLGRGTEADEDKMPDADPTTLPPGPHTPGGRPTAPGAASGPGPAWSAFASRQPTRHQPPTYDGHPGCAEPQPYGSPPAPADHRNPRAAVPGHYPSVDPEAVRAAFDDRPATDPEENGPHRTSW